MKTVITVNREPAGPGYQAHWVEDHRLWERGNTEVEAIGKLAITLGFAETLGNPANVLEDFHANFLRRGGGNIPGFEKEAE